MRQISLKQFDYRRNELSKQPLNLVIDRSSLDIIDIKVPKHGVFEHQR